MSTLVNRYEQDLANGFQEDPLQRQAVEALEEVRAQLVCRYEQARQRGVFHRFMNLRRMQPVQGIYFWGGVGRGKTWLMDLFFASLPFRRKMRSHFNRFMQRVHMELKSLSGEANPLDHLADRLAQEAVIICFDEFYVQDITDAMLLGMLFSALFARGVTLVATSNIEPDGLYAQGLQRERFLPAIALIKQHCQVMHLDSGRDYRLRHLRKVPLFYTPHNDWAETALLDRWMALSGQSPHPTQLQINDRPMPVRAASADVVWIEFAVLCEQMRSQNDYIELARRFPTLILDRLRVLGWEDEDPARRLVNLIDELYDRRVKLILSADQPLEQIYQGRKLRFEFQRTLSRLTEMQSQEYLESEYRP